MCGLSFFFEFPVAASSFEEAAGLFDWGWCVCGWGRHGARGRVGDAAPDWPRKQREEWRRSAATAFCSSTFSTQNKKRNDAPFFTQSHATRPYAPRSAGCFGFGAFLEERNGRIRAPCGGRIREGGRAPSASTFLRLNFSPPVACRGDIDLATPLKGTGSGVESNKKKTLTSLTPKPPTLSPAPPSPAGPPWPPRRLQPCWQSRAPRPRPPPPRPPAWAITKQWSWRPPRPSGVPR